jgi:hypothetical protein
MLVLEDNVKFMYGSVLRVQRNTIVSACDFTRRGVERAFEGALSPCSVPVVALGGWTKLKQGIVIERREGPRLRWEWSNEN